MSTFPPDPTQQQPFAPPPGPMDAGMMDPGGMGGMDQLGQPDQDEQPESNPLTASFLQLSDLEVKRLSDQVYKDYTNAVGDHRVRMNKLAHYYNLWRTPVGGPDGSLGKPNYKVPIIEWMIMAKLANVVDSLFGDDAEIVADPVGPTDQDNSPKVGLYMTWLFFTAMKAKSPLITFLFRCFLAGRAFCWIPYCKKSFEDAAGNEQIEYEGPEFIPLWPDDLIVPGEQVTSLHEFSYVIRRYRETPDDLLRGEMEGKYEPGSISDPANWARIFTAATANENRNLGADNAPVQTVNDGIEGITYGGQSARDTVEVLEWHGRWRLPKDPTSDAGLSDWDARDMKETDLIIRRITEIDHVISKQRHVDLYPSIKDRRPFDEMPLMDTGEYWCKGYPEMLIDTAYELTVNNNLRTEAGEMTVAPPIGVKKGMGYQFKQGRYGARQVIELDNPAVDVRTLDVRMDLQYTTMQEQALLSYAERLSGISDQTLGRAIDRPNAPRTARGQLALISKGDVRLNLDNVTLREHLSRILQRIWNIDSTYADANVFFRVTEEKANGLFATSKGFGKMTAEERGGRYDFQVKFATSSMSKEAEKDKAEVLFQSALATPLVQTNMVAQWHLLDQFFKAMGRTDFKTIMPEPPPMDIPMNPIEEWTRILQGEPVSVHWGDVDDDHITQHRTAIEDQINSPDPDFSAVKKMGEHIIAHIQQKNAKMAYAVQAAARQAAIGAFAAAHGLDPQMLSQQAAQEQQGMANPAPMNMQPGQQPGGMPQPGGGMPGASPMGDLSRGMPGME